MGTIQYKLNGKYSPLMVTLRSDTVDGPIVDSTVLQSVGTLNTFDNVPIGSYFVVGYDRALGIVSSVILSVV